MAKKVTDSNTLPVNPFTNWWVRAGMSFLAGIFLGIISHLLPDGTYIGFLFGFSSFVLAIVGPIMFIIMALKEEHESKRY